MRVSSQRRSAEAAFFALLLSSTAASVMLVSADASAAGTSGASGASSAPSSSANAFLPQARSAWDRGDWKRTELLYKQTLDAGGLSPSEALDAYVRLGSAETLLKKRDLAMVAFRHAALLEPKFKLPSVAGRKGAQLVALAKKQEAKIGPINLRSEIPQNVSAGVPLDVAATLDADHAAILAKIDVVATDSNASQVYTDATAAGTDVHFTLPASIFTTGSTLTVRIDALDANANRMATVERTVNVGASIDGPAVGAGGVNAGAAGSSHVSAPNVMFSDVKPIDADKGSTRDKRDDKGGGFWSSPWPYVIGGLALAAGGAAVYVETRPGDDVSIGAPRINAR